MKLSRLGCAACLLLLAATPLPPGEVAPAASLPCFSGAIYRKAVSSVDQWTGIEATVTLPTFASDPARVDANGRPLDNPSIYLGGRAGETEIDCGVSWEVVREPDGTVSKQRKAFRPFWRNKTWFSAPARPDLYFYPGDTIEMRCETRDQGKLTFTVRLLRRDGGVPSTTRPAEPGVHEATFDAPGFGPAVPQQFKRVNAIDQVGNEGKSVAPTQATTTATLWTRVELLRAGGGSRPMVVERFTDMRCPDAAHVVVAATEGGDGSGEKVDLVGTPAK